MIKEDNTKEKILNSAKEVFSKKGYTRATTKEISNTANVAEITLFRHFKTKKILFYETITKYLVNPLMDSRVSNDNSDLEETILRLIQERIHTLKNNKDLFMCTIYEAQFNEEIKDIIQKIYSKVFSVLVCYVKKEFEFKKLKDVHIARTVQLFLSTIVGVIMFESLIDNNELVNSDELVEIIKTFISDNISN